MYCGAFNGQSIVRSLCRSFLEGRCSNYAFRGGGVGSTSSPTSVKLYIYMFFHFSIFVAGCRLRSMSVKGEFRNWIRNMQNEKRHLIFHDGDLEGLFYIAYDVYYH